MCACEFALLCPALHHRAALSQQKKTLAGLIDRAANDWARTPPLDGGEDEDADTRTDAAVPDDNDDIASFTGQQTTAIDTPNL